MTSRIPSWKLPGAFSRGGGALKMFAWVNIFLKCLIFFVWFFVKLIESEMSLFPWNVMASVSPKHDDKDDKIAFLNKLIESRMCS